MDIRKLQRVIVDGLEDVKAQNIVVFNTEHLSSLFERVIIASGTSNRQTKSLASSVRDAVKTAGYPIPRTEGESNGEWIIIDCGAAVVLPGRETLGELRGRQPRAAFVQHHAPRATRHGRLEPHGFGRHQLLGRLAAARLGLHGLQLQAHLGRKALREVGIRRLRPRRLALAHRNEPEFHAVPATAALNRVPRSCVPAPSSRGSWPPPS